MTNKGFLSIEYIDNKIVPHSDRNNMKKTNTQKEVLSNMINQNVDFDNHKKEIQCEFGDTMLLFMPLKFCMTFFTILITSGIAFYLFN